jgi:hypothetical protein
VRGGSACAHSGRDRRPAGQSRGGRTRTPARRTRHATQINQHCAVRERVCHHECFILPHRLDNQNHHHTESGTADSSLRASPLCVYVRKSALFLTLHLLQLRNSAAAAAVRIGARRPHLLRPRGLQPPHALLLRVHVPRGLQALRLRPRWRRGDVSARVPACNTHIRTCIRVWRGELIGLIILRTDSDSPTYSYFPGPIISPRTRACMQPPRISCTCVRTLCLC